ncbi:MAG TPA: DUF6510 family protein [Candidatus Limnocylindria bacterium]|nr:DUF6510 family protein [Candidatus Limnocylindria bacterium]
MADEPADQVAEAVLDGNALAGALASVLGVEATSIPGRCAHCGTVSMVGALRAYTRAPGAVLRCPACGQVVLRLVETDSAVYLDARGAAFLRFDR